MIVISLMINIIGLSSVSTQYFFPQQIFRFKGADEDFLDSFYEQIPFSVTEICVEISDSRWIFIEYFPCPVVNNAPYVLKSLAIRNSSVREISEAAFEELQDLEILDLTSNLLDDLSFVSGLPVHLKKLYLNDNEITDVKHVFYHFDELELLELSENHISVVDSSALFGVHNVVLSRNFITDFRNDRYSRFMALDLSYNNISQFNASIFDDYRMLNSLNLSHNPLISLRVNRRYIDVLDICNTSIQNVPHRIIIRNLIMSYKELEIIDRSSTLLINQLVIKNSNISKLSKGTVRSMESVDLSYLSIEDIARTYFNNIQLRMLNLSNNNINTLRSDIFLHANIAFIDFSHSHIEYLKPGVFSSVTAISIDLSHNIIRSVENIFQGVTVNTLNLSFNRIRAIDRHSFVNMYSLTTLDLSHNKFLILEEHTFNNLPIETLKFQGNRIKTIRMQAFNNLSSLYNLNLSSVHLNNLEMHAFNNLSRVETVDLSNNEITVIPPNLFNQMNNLTTIELTGNNITSLNKFSNKLRLRNLSVSYSGSFKANMISNFRIQYLTIEKSSISVLENDSFKGLFNLKALYFNKSDILFVDQGALNDLYHLEFLDTQNMFKHTKHIRKNTFADLRSLRFLNLSQLSLESFEGDSFKGLNKLEYLMADHNYLTSLPENVFVGLNELKMLDLSHNNITRVDVGVLGILPNLKELNLGYNKIVVVSSYFLAGLRSLEILNLRNNHISTIDHDAFSDLTSLKKFFIQENQILKIPIGSFQYLSELKILNISYNHFELFQIGVFSNLKRLEILDLSNTSLIKLEEESIFFPMVNLKKLYLDRNHLKQFNMKRVIANLKSIIHVGISHNKWTCNTLSIMIETLNSKGIQYNSSAPVFESHNIDGIGCIDICEFVYCSPEKGEPDHDQ